MSEQSQTWSSWSLFSKSLAPCSISNSNETLNHHHQSTNKHSEFILNGLQILKANNILCDVTLIAQSKKYHVHKVLMASVSDYFRSMFTSGMKESKQAEIELKGVSARGLEKLIEIIYTSKTKFETNSDLFDVISCASHLQCLLVLDYCEKNMLNRLTCKNFNYFIQMAKMYRMQSALDKIDLFIIKNLSQIINQSSNKRFKNKHDEFASSFTDNYDDDEYDIDSQDSDIIGLNSLTYEQILKCLSNDNLRIREIDLFLLTWQWINQTLLISKPNRTQLNLRVRINENKFKRKISIIRNLMKKIRFSQINANDLIKKVQNINSIMLSDKYLRSLVLNALNYHLVGASDNLNMKTRSPIRSLLLIGGREINPNPTMHDSCYLLNSLLNNIECTSAKKIRKTPLTSLPNNLSHMQCVLVDNLLYIIGGCLSQCAHGESAVSTTYRYDTSSNKWISIGNMIEKRAYFYACSLKLNEKNYLFSFGGKNRDGSLCSIEKFNFENNKWSFSQSLPATYYAHTGAVLNNVAYLSGGYTNGHFTPDLYSYNPLNDRVEELRPMNVSRGWHSMCAANDLLYVFGGCYLNNQTSGQQLAQAITITEYYSPQTDQWTIVKPMVNLHKEASCLKLNNYIYIFGGYNIQAKSGQKLISKYDFMNDTWHTVGHLSNGMTGFGCVSMDLPWFLIDKDKDYENNFNKKLNHLVDDTSDEEEDDDDDDEFESNSDEDFDGENQTNSFTNNNSHSDADSDNENEGKIEEI
ncbi:unnamed protein product [Brachionus calyciflorus]|uniref:BTB domain-containing protein n=1 Tax=Brachionus calyciflorus TaxID=104777 RepID=A0A813XSZ5_9BILA|nr:unnamed protein product [Brachionus calyciflorus]